MKIVNVTPYYHPVKGGVTSFVAGLAGVLGRQEGNSVEILVQQGDAGSSIEHISGDKRKAISDIYRRLCRKKPDVVHCHGHWHLLAGGVRYRKKHPDANLVFTFHTFPLRKMKGYKKKAFEKLLARCDAVTFSSDALRERVLENLKIDVSIHVVHAGVFPIDVGPEDALDFKKSWGLEGASPLLLFLGALSWAGKVEGVRSLILAMPRIKKGLPDAKLAIVGDGEHLEELKALAVEKGVGGCVVFTGNLDDAKLALAACDIYTHISFQEGGVSLSILEAMVLGKPVVAARSGGIVELVKHEENGLLVDGKPEEIAETVTGLATDKARMLGLGKAGQEYVKARHTWEGAAEKFLRVYSGK